MENYDADPGIKKNTKDPDSSNYETPDQFQQGGPVFNFKGQKVPGMRTDGPMTKDERGRLNKAVKQLKEIGATPDDITIRAENFVLSYGFNPAPQSITSLYSKLTKVQPKLTKKQLEDVQKQAINSGRWAELEKKHGE